MQLTLLDKALTEQLTKLKFSTKPSPQHRFKRRCPQGLADLPFPSLEQVQLSSTPVIAQCSHGKSPHHSPQSRSTMELVASSLRPMEADQGASLFRRTPAQPTRSPLPTRMARPRKLAVSLSMLIPQLPASMNFQLIPPQMD